MGIAAKVVKELEGTRVLAQYPQEGFTLLEDIQGKFLVVNESGDTQDIDGPFILMRPSSNLLG